MALPTPTKPTTPQPSVTPKPAEAPKAPPAAASFKYTVEGLVKDWAQSLVPQNAPKLHIKGPLAWVRETKVAELIEILEKAGYK